MSIAYRDNQTADVRSQPDWIEQARQAFMWRHFYDDCGRSHQRTSDPGVRGPRVDIARCDLGVSGTTTTEQAA